MVELVIILVLPLSLACSGADSYTRTGMRMSSSDATSLLSDSALLYIYLITLVWKLLGSEIASYKRPASDRFFVVVFSPFLVL